MNEKEKNGMMQEQAALRKVLHAEFDGEEETPETVDAINGVGDEKDEEKNQEE